MKRKIAMMAAVVSGLYLLVPDPLPLVDEGLMLMIFLASMKALGKDGNWWLPFLGRKDHSHPSRGTGFRGKARETTIDV